jgi:hypothetical protein
MKLRFIKMFCFNVPKRDPIADVRNDLFIRRILPTEQKRQNGYAEQRNHCEDGAVSGWHAHSSKAAITNAQVQSRLKQRRSLDQTNNKNRRQSRQGSHRKLGGDR